MRALASINLAVFIATIGYGITFPLLSIRLEKMGLSGGMIGIHSAMPALGWIFGSLLMPQLQARYGVKRLVLAFLAIGVAALSALSYTDQQLPMLVHRFLFGGGVGLAFRGIEYWINAESERDVRGRNLGIYSAVFMLGIALGSLIQPMLGTADRTAFVVAVAVFLAAAVIVTQIPGPQQVEAPASAFSLALVAAVPAAFVGFIAFGVWESIPAYLAPAYALKNGSSEEIAAATLTAAALGSIFIPAALGMVSDHIGRTIPLVGCSIVAAVLAAAIPFYVANAAVFLGLFAILAGCASSVYSLALAHMGDRHQEHSLVVANAACGTIYAMASLIGPLLNGAALDTLNSHGLMVSCSAIFAVLALTVVSLRHVAPRSPT